MPWETSQSHGFPPAVRRLILERDPTCRCPGCPQCAHGCHRPSTQADHIQPVHLGGTHHPSNGQGLCHWCHRTKTLHEATQARARKPKPARQPEPHPGLTTQHP